jgi:hypothetical protein
MAPPKLHPALLGGLFAGVLSALPFVNVANCCCLWMITGGVLAAYIMQANHPLPISIGDGAAVGFLAGLIGGIIAILVGIPVKLFILPMLPHANQVGMTFSSRELPPEARQMMEALARDRGVMALLFGGLSILVELFFGTIGGMFGALVFRKAPPPSEPPSSPSHPPVILPAGPPVESWSYPDQDQKSEPPRSSR